MDMEMTGLNPDTDTVLEIATLITNDALELIVEGPTFVIQHAQATLDRMDAWNTEHHGKSGLMQRALESTVTIEQAEARTLEFVKTYCVERKSPLCGNSIWQDRRFLCRYMPKVDAYLHYRNIDVSTVKELVRRWFPDGPEAPEKKHAHLALDDIRESIAELQFYRQNFFKS